MLRYNFPSKRLELILYEEKSYNTPEPIEINNNNIIHKDWKVGDIWRGTPEEEFSHKDSQSIYFTVFNNSSFRTKVQKGKQNNHHHILVPRDYKLTA